MSRHQLDPDTLPKATIDGEVTLPFGSGRIRGTPSSTTAMATLDVPKSMPMTAPVRVTACRAAQSGGPSGVKACAGQACYYVCA